MRNHWQTSVVRTKSPLGALVDRSRLIGDQESLGLFGGGNTSTKCEQRDLFGILARADEIETEIRLIALLVLAEDRKHGGGNYRQNADGDQHLQKSEPGTAGIELHGAKCETS